ncbi:MAG: hypothetical protein JWN69_1787 [Alphaproteobacteria bacterium]|nr:hypothetical protein [Alphaproteobacteria bacterium]
MRTIWKMSSAEPAANYPAEPLAQPSGKSPDGLHLPMQADGAQPDFMVDDDEDDGFDWNFESAAPPARVTPDPRPGPSLSLSPASEAEQSVSTPVGEPGAAVLLDPGPMPEPASQPELPEEPGLVAQPELVEQPGLPEPAQASEKKVPSLQWPAAMALLVAAVVVLLFFARQWLDAPQPAPAPAVADEAFEPTASFPPSPMIETGPMPAAPLASPSLKAAPPALPAAPIDVRRVPAPKQKAAEARPRRERQRPPRRRAQARQPVAALVATISCILPGGEEVQTSYPSCRARGGVIYR